MAQASRKLRRTRRLKRERTLANRMVDHLLQERAVNRGMINYLIEQLPKKDGVSPEVTITRVEDGPEVVTTGTVEVVPVE